MKITHLLLVSGIFMATVLPANAAPKNLIDNGSFEQIEKNEAVDWYNPKPKVDAISVEFLQEKGHGTTATLKMSRDDGAYFIQSVKVEPHSHYRLSLLARMNQGVITVVVKGGKDENKVEHRLLGQVHTRLTMFPSFWNERSSKFLVFEANQWRPVTLDLDSGELTKVDVLIGDYYKKGSYSFDDVSVVKVDR